ncbi:25.3 kDa vesicle transport protein SEC22-1 isoform X2 [Populus nigra]|uniref:25.3 kDa vesicle transport protein SEC22-1 isoform X2 n=1 Tax=Populus nigra TaxID=3691 RepID=UPI002B267AED|nr:25.3 kDa vesicle transport protein SEC22-1 isoform X2 [Populus nigra]
MVKITIVGRVIDGLPLAQGPRYVSEENDNFLCYKQQGEFILKEISRGALIPSMMTIRIDHHSLKKLAFHYLQDLQKEFERLDNSLVEKITRPYSFVKFDGVIGSIRKQYIDTRTQANLSKLNANRKKDLEIITEHISEILQRKRNSEISERLPATTPRTASPIWGSPLLEVIALKWTPITTIVAVAAILLWASLVLTDNFII